MNKKCIECENKNLLKVSDLSIDLAKAKDYIKLLQKCLDIKEELNKVLREENENLKYKLELYEESK